MKQYKQVNGKKIELTKQEIDNRAVEASAWDVEKVRYAAEEGYKDERIAEYPSIEEQLDMLYHDKIDGTTVWKDVITAIKEAHPKPQE